MIHKNPLLLITLIGLLLVSISLLIFIATIIVNDHKRRKQLIEDIKKNPITYSIVDNKVVRITKGDK